MRLKIVYEENLSVELDDALEEVLSRFGYERWASGFNLETRERDLAFEKPVPTVGGKAE